MLLLLLLLWHWWLHKCGQDASTCQCAHISCLRTRWGRPDLVPLTGQALAWLDWAAAVPTKAAAGMAAWRAAPVAAALWALSCPVQRCIHLPETPRDLAGQTPGRRLDPLAETSAASAQQRLEMLARRQLLLSLELLMCRLWLPGWMR